MKTIRLLADVHTAIQAVEAVMDEPPEDDFISKYASGVGFVEI